LRTPLAILQGLTDLATRTPNVPQPLGNWLEQLRKATSRMSHLVNQIVTMLEAGQFDRPLESASTPIPELLDEAAGDVQAFVDVRSQTLERDWPADLGAAVVDRAKLRDSLNHLLLNAIKFTPDGGRISLSARGEGDDTLLISVRDTGVGIDPAALPRLGDRFFTGFDVSRHSSGHFEYGRRGLGLGLSVVKAFVEMQGGVLKVESEVGKGTTFTIRLPRRPVESAEPASPAVPAAAESAQ
jgi:signal transduction histidine kinase